MVKTYAPHFTNWLVAGATFVRTLNVELQGRQLFVDALIEIVTNGEPGLLLIEFQSSSDPEMGRRVSEYSIEASHEYDHYPVYPFVVYLRKARAIAQSPSIYMRPDGREEAKQQWLRGQREMLLSFLQRDFPEVVILAAEQLNKITDPEIMRASFLKLVHAQAVEDAKKILFDVDPGSEKH